MKRVLLVLPALLALVSPACHQKPETDWINEPYPEKQKAIEQTVQAIFETAQAKDLAKLDGFHLYGPKFTKFDDGEDKQRLNAAQGKQKENELFGALENFKFNISDLKADVFGEVGIATFIIDYQARVQGQDIAGKVRGTLVFVEDAGQWKITHEHFSPG